MKLRIWKNCMLLLAIGGLVATADGIMRPNAEIRHGDELRQKIRDANRAGHARDGKRSEYEGNLRFGNQLQASKTRVERLTGEGRRIALIGLLVAGCALTGLWLCADIEINKMRGAQPTSPGGVLKASPEKCRWDCEDEGRA